MNEGIRLKVDYEPSERPEDGGFSHLKEVMKGNDDLLVSVLDDLDRNVTKKKIILEALISVGKTWNDLYNLSDNKDVAYQFGRLVAHWNTPIDGVSPTEAQLREKALKFAKLLN